MSTGTQILHNLYCEILPHEPPTWRAEAPKSFRPGSPPESKKLHKAHILDGGDKEWHASTLTLWQGHLQKLIRTAPGNDNSLQKKKCVKRRWLVCKSSVAQLWGQFERRRPSTDCASVFGRDECESEIALKNGPFQGPTSVRRETVCNRCKLTPPDSASHTMNESNTDFLPLCDVDDDVQCFDHAFCSSPVCIFLDSEESDHPETEGLEDISTGPIVSDGNSPDGVRSPLFEMEYESDSSSWPHPDYESQKPVDDDCSILAEDELPEDRLSLEEFSDLDRFSMDQSPEERISGAEGELLLSRRGSRTPEAVPLDNWCHPTTDSEELE